LHLIVALDFQGLLDQPLDPAAHPFVPFLRKELFPLRVVQLKMAVAEDFQFWHEGVPPL
jgi:hypothetical protein